MKIKGSLSKLLFILLLSIFVFGMIFTGCFRSAAEEEAVMEEAAVSREPEALVVEEAPAEMEVAEEYVAEEKVVSETDIQYSDTQIPVDRKVIKTAYIELEVGEGKFEDTLFELTSLAEQNEGFVSSSQSYSDPDGNLTSGYITIRIPHNKYSSAIDKIKGMGTVRSISFSGQDVTQEYTDLESRLRNYQAQEEVLLDLMKQSKKVSDSIEVQRELSNVQEQIEIIKGRIKYLDEMVAFSTIDVYLYEPEPVKTAADWGFVDALKRGLRGAVSVFNGLMVFLIAASPVLVIIAIILIVIWQVIRARKRRRVKKEQK